MLLSDIAYINSTQKPAAEYHGLLVIISITMICLILWLVCAW
jgi:hypothetical protein